MRILHSIHSVNPEGGGPIEVIRQFAPLDSQAGHEIAVASMDNPAQPFVQNFPGILHAFGPSLPRYGFAHRYVPWLQRARQSYDVVIINGLWQYPSIGTWLALHGTETPYVVFPHGMLDPWFKHAYPFKHIKKSLYWPIAEYKVLRDAAAVLFTSEEERLNASQSFHPYQCREIVLGYGTTDPSNNPHEAKELFFKRYPHLREKQIVLFLSRIHEKKGCDYLLDAFSRLILHYPRLHLVMAGPENSGYGRRLRERHAAGLDERVTWTGMLSGDLKWGAMHACDALILPSHQENFGVVVAEALACGKPVLISNKVNIFRDILDDEAGLVGPDDLPGTEQLLERWLSMTSDQKIRMQINARQCFIRRFEIHSVYDRLISILERVAGDTGKPSK